MIKSCIQSARCLVGLRYIGRGRLWSKKNFLLYIPVLHLQCPPVSAGFGSEAASLVT